MGAPSRLPDFIGIGPAHAGTTWLHWVLRPIPVYRSPRRKRTSSIGITKRGWTGSGPAFRRSGRQPAKLCRSSLRFPGYAADRSRFAETTVQSLQCAPDEAATTRLGAKRPSRDELAPGSKLEKLVSFLGLIWTWRLCFAGQFPPIDERLDSQLRREYLPKIEALERLTSLDLSGWKS